MADQQATLLQRIAQVLAPDTLNIVYSHERKREVADALTWHQLMAWCTAIDDDGVRRGLDYPECDVTAAYKRMFRAADRGIIDEGYRRLPAPQRPWVDMTFAHLFLGKPTWDDFQRRGRGDEFLVRAPLRQTLTSGTHEAVYDYRFVDVNISKSR